ncbi:hypothetical protein CK203_014101 [Vitis vinifera]|uniref:Uncharacterized protein n=1 Tax=Vitis vinifera TaxID=29760 RepID=A0A438JHK1_VITVI|nr:hypothetical protein CK203_014101 [Vitis vinifera]
MLIVKQNRETSVRGQREGNRSREYLPLPAKQQLSIHSNNPNSAPVCLLGDFPENEAESRGFSEAGEEAVFECVLVDIVRIGCFASHSCAQSRKRSGIKTADE